MDTWIQYNLDSASLPISSHTIHLLENLMPPYWPNFHFLEGVISPSRPSYVLPPFPGKLFLPLFTCLLFILIWKTLSQKFFCQSPTLKMVPFIMFFHRSYFPSFIPYRNVFVYFIFLLYVFFHSALE